MMRPMPQIFTSISKVVLKNVYHFSDLIHPTTLGHFLWKKLYLVISLIGSISVMCSTSLWLWYFLIFHLYNFYFSKGHGFSYLTYFATCRTLSPMNSFSSELGVQFGTCLEAPHVIDVESQVFSLEVYLWYSLVIFDFVIISAGIYI